MRRQKGKKILIYFFLFLIVGSINNKALTRVQFENIKIDLNKQLIFRNKTEFKINNTEKTILEKMINNPGKIFERIEIGKLIDLDKERSKNLIIF